MESTGTTLEKTKTSMKEGRPATQKATNEARRAT